MPSQINCSALAEGAERVAANDNCRVDQLPFLVNPRLARRKSTGQPFVASVAERVAARARAARRTAETERAMEQHRARLTARRVADNDNAPRWRGNLPVLHAIARRDPDAAYAIAVFGRSHAYSSEVYADETAGFEGEPEAPKPDRLYPEQRHEISPSIEEIFSDLLRVRVVTEKRKDGGALPGRDRAIEYRHAGPATPPRKIGDSVNGLGDLRFNLHPKARLPAGGTMMSFVGRDGEPRAPFYDTSKRRGGKWTGLERHRPGVTRPICFSQPDDRPHVSAATAEIIEMILAGMHLFEIGVALGFSRDYADRGAKAPLAAAIAEIKAACPLPARAPAGKEEAGRVAA